MVSSPEPIICKICRLQFVIMWAEINFVPGMGDSFKLWLDISSHLLPNYCFCFRNFLLWRYLFIVETKRRLKWHKSISFTAIKCNFLKPVQPWHWRQLVNVRLTVIVLLSLEKKSRHHHWLLKSSKCPDSEFIECTIVKKMTQMRCS
jgi:hypothetical protein